MGALTLKSFPFILRSWNVKNYDSINPTDSFGEETKVYENRNKIVKIEPQFVNNANNPWLSDKGRQFFDSIFSNNDSSLKSLISWKTVFLNFQKTFYIFDMCNFKNVNKFYYIIVFENLNVENLSFLSSISQTYPFIRVRRAESIKFNVDLETDHMVNNVMSSPHLLSSSLCLSVGMNSRYEGSLLNLKLRQRYLKGDFKFFSIGSLLNLTFPVKFMGSNTLIFKLIACGNHAVCQEITSASNPLLITNSEVFKKNNFQEIFNIFKILKHVNVLNNVWNGYNVLNSSLYETGLNNLGQFPAVFSKDLLSFSFIHIINVNLNNVANFKKVLESRLILNKSFSVQNSEKLLINQNLSTTCLNFNDSNFLYIPNNVFFDNQDTFINTEGLIKRTTKLILKKNVKTDWQILRRFFKVWSSSTSLNISKLNSVVVHYSDFKLFDFKNFIGFQFYASKTLTSVNFHLIDQTQKFSIFKNYYRFKNPILKVFNTKLKYWLDDFYTGGKDKFCQNSLTLTRCSMNYKEQITNFF